jgi:glycosyltransferase involved in cell wall biosynthesis
MSSDPVVSIVMPVYNGERYLPQALASIEQQSFSDWELIAIDDGSTDGSRDLLVSAASRDRRVTVVHQGRGGLAAALNAGIDTARGRYIARMDCDDVSLPHRLARQVALLDGRPSVALVGSSYEVIDGAGRPLGVFQAVSEHDDIAREMYVRNPYGHGTVMMRREVAVEGYRAGNTDADYELWIRLMRRYRLANVPEVLYRWRVAPGSVTQAGARELHALVARLIDVLWAESAPSPLPLRALISRSRRYSGETRRQLICDQHALGLALLARGHRAAGIAAISRAALMDPTCIRIVRTLLVGDQSARGYNMYAHLPSPAREGRWGFVRRWIALLLMGQRSVR